MNTTSELERECSGVRAALLSQVGASWRVEMSGSGGAIRWWSAVAGTERTFRICAGEERFSDKTKLRGVIDVVTGIVNLESGGQFVSVVEDLLGGAGHGGHLRCAGRAVMAYTMIGASSSTS